MYTLPYIYRSISTDLYLQIYIYQINAIRVAKAFIVVFSPLKMPHKCEGHVTFTLTLSYIFEENIYMSFIFAYKILSTLINGNYEKYLLKTLRLINLLNKFSISYLI